MKPTEVVEIKVIRTLRTLWPQGTFTVHLKYAVELCIYVSTESLGADKRTLSLSIDFEEARVLVNNRTA